MSGQHASEDHVDRILHDQADLERRLLPDDHVALARSRCDLAIELYKAGDLEDARSWYLDALTAYEGALAKEPVPYTFLAEIASIHDMLAECVLDDLGRADEAGQHAAAALATLTRLRDVVDREIADRLAGRPASGPEL